MNTSKLNKIMTVATFITAMLISPYATAVDDVALVRTSCASYPNQTCFTTMADANSWIVSQSPSATSPVLVDVGPGQFDKFTCLNSGWITLRGSGKNNTEISRGASGGGPRNNYGASLTNCSNVTIQDLTITNGTNTLKINNAIGTGSGLVFQNIDINATNSIANTISWIGDGVSSWLNVNVTGAGESGSWVWHDTCIDTERPQHYWFGSTLTSSSTGLYNVTYSSVCGDSWFYGSEIAAFAIGGNNLRNEAVELSFEATLHVFGSALRSAVMPGATQSGGHALSTVRLLDNSSFHMHGGIINADASQSNASEDRDAIGIAMGVNSATTSNATAHVIETAFNVKPKGNGKKIRIEGNTASPYQWPADVAPPANLVSLTGADTFVETDCNANGDCDTAGGTETHMMIYNPTCNTAGNWFDSTTGRCRGVTN